MSDASAHDVRLNAVESEVSAVRQEMGGIKDNVSRLTADVRGLGGVLSRIEDSILRAQDKDDKRQERSKPNFIALTAVLVTVIIAMLGGAWTTAERLGRLDERSAYTQLQIDKAEQRLWFVRRGG